MNSIKWDVAVAERTKAAYGAMGMLKAFITCGFLPEVHQASAQRLSDEFDAAQKAMDKAECESEVAHDPA